MRRGYVFGIFALAMCGTLASTSGAVHAEAPRFVGERIDIELQDAELEDVLDLFRDVGKVNIVKQADVQAGAITVHFEAVRWDEALFLILESQRLEMVREDNIIYVRPGC